MEEVRRRRRGSKGEDKKKEQKVRVGGFREGGERDVKSKDEQERGGEKKM